MLQPARFLTSLALALLGLGAAAAEIKKAPVDFPGLKFRLVGPFVGGRATRVQGLAGDPFTYYVSTASGGRRENSDTPL